MLVRQASLADVDQVTDAFITAMSTDPSWAYRFPHRHEQPGDHRKYNRDLTRRFLSPDYSDWLVMVVEVTDQAAPDTPKIVSLAVWDLSYVNKRIHGPAYEPQNPNKDVADAGGSTRRDGDAGRVAAFRAALAPARKRFFDDAFGSDQIYLQWLGTLPGYRRCGFATSLVRWGMEKAACDGVAVTLSASPQGFQLYSGLGFRDLGSTTVQVTGEEEYLVVKAMAYEPTRV